MGDHHTSNPSGIPSADFLKLLKKRFFFRWHSGYKIRILWEQNDSPEMVQVRACSLIGHSFCRVKKAKDKKWYPNASSCLNIHFHFTVISKDGALQRVQSTWAHFSLVEHLDACMIWSPTASSGCLSDSVSISVGRTCCNVFVTD